ncbi:MAG: hypothetical protein EHM58_08740 [Ignavibacteriae bacterium]|nr:MAG: hypothetical protein EHM58_08740 [Ignavibacteriota bacterium]
MIIIKYIGTFIAILVVVIIIGLLVKKDKQTTPTYYNKQIKYVNGQEKNPDEELKDQYRIGVTFSDDKAQIIDLIKGNVTFKLVYEGNTRFISRILKPDGTLIALIADKQGSFEETTSVTVPETGSYILDIKTTGKWSFARS